MGNRGVSSSAPLADRTHTRYITEDRGGDNVNNQLIARSCHRAPNPTPRWQSWGSSQRGLFICGTSRTRGWLRVAVGVSRGSPPPFPSPWARPRGPLASLHVFLPKLPAKRGAAPISDAEVVKTRFQKYGLFLGDKQPRLRKKKKKNPLKKKKNPRGKFWLELHTEAERSSEGMEPHRELPEGGKPPPRRGREG